MTKRNNYLIKKYGITEDQYATLLATQNGCCAVCKRPASQFKVRLAVDHEHLSGCIRGLLCNYCNRRIIGRHRKEVGADLLRNAYEYLRNEYTGWIVPPKAKKKRKKKHGPKKLRVRS